MARMLADGQATPRSVVSKKSTKRPTTVRLPSRTNVPTKNFKPARPVVATNKPARAPVKSTKPTALQIAIAAMKAKSAAKIPKGTQPVKSPTQLYQAKKVSAPAANTAFKALAARNAANVAKNTAKPVARPAAKPVVKAAAPVVKVAAPAVKAVAKPVAAVAKPATTTVQGSGTAAKTTNLSGKGAFGRFQRKRQNRGPRSALSMTPEMLASAARQRIVNYG